MADNLISKEEAIKKAKQAAAAVYDTIDLFEFKVAEDYAHWIIDFIRPEALEDGEKQHFAIWINKETEELYFFKGR